MEVEVIGAMNSRCRIEPRLERHRNHDGFLDSSMPAEISAKDCRRHDSRQETEILYALDMQAAVRLNILCQSSRRLNVFLVENILVIHVEHDQKEAHRKCPLRKKCQRPLKWDTPEES